MTGYTPGDHEAELLLGQAYVRMLKDGDLERFFVRPLTVAQFFAGLQPPVGVLFDHDQEGIFVICLIERLFKAGVFSLWVRADKRHSAAAYRCYLRSLVTALTLFPNVIGVTGQEGLVDQHCRLGYTMKCKIDGLYGPDRPGWVLEVDRARIFERVRRTRWSNDERAFFTEIPDFVW